MYRVVAVFAATVSFVPACFADAFDDARDHIRTVLVEQSVPSVAVAVAKDGRIIWEEGFGWADREKRLPASEHTMYSLASTSKPITATGLMVLAQAGKVNLDAPANDYLGNVKLRARVGDAREATVRRVANHTAGLPRHSHVLYADEPRKVPSRDETILRYGNLVTAPGGKFQYSNLGYGVLDYIIERASGSSYAEFMRREVFMPLGLTRTAVDAAIGPDLHPHAATRYGADGLPVPAYDVDHPGATAVYASAHDLVRFGMFHLKAHLRDQQAILSDAAIDEMHRDTVPEAAYNGYRYGVGFLIHDRNGHHYIEHSGGMGGASSQMFLFPKEKLAVVVLSNSATAPTGGIADRIIGMLLPRWKPDERREGVDPEPEPFVARPELLGTWKGTLATYLKDVPLELHFRPDGEVHARVDGQPTALVSRAAFKDGEFSGVVMARVGTPDADYYADRIRLSLTLRDHVLNGAAFAAGHYPRGLYHPRWRSTLAHWVDLQRESAP